MRIGAQWKQTKPSKMIRSSVLQGPEGICGLMSTRMPTLIGFASVGIHLHFL
jgi:hypothetical protein